MPASPVLVAVHPHPDDESIAVGGSLARYGREGVATHVITCTGGEAGDNLAGIDLEGRAMPQQRRREMADAAAVLGLASHTWLGYRDSGMAGTAANRHPEAFANADLGEAARRLATHLRRLRPDVVVSDDERGTYGHPDHVMAHRVTVAAVAAAADPGVDLPGAPHRVPRHLAHAMPRERVRAVHRRLVTDGLTSPFEGLDVAAFGVDEDRIDACVDVTEHLATKQAAMLAHRSQVAPDSAFFNIPDDLWEQTLGVECFVVVSSAIPLGPRTDGHRRDLFDGWVP